MEFSMKIKGKAIRLLQVILQISIARYGANKTSTSFKHTHTIVTILSHVNPAISV